jgi:hypothetical protein
MDRAARMKKVYTRRNGEKKAESSRRIMHWLSDLLKDENQV